MRMEAYYFRFEPTECYPVDKILSSVACAGKGFHNTSNWNDEIGKSKEFPDGYSYVDLIQQSAFEASILVKEMEQDFFFILESICRDRNDEQYGGLAEEAYKLKDKYFTRKR